MDYETKPIKRIEIRAISCWIRNLFNQNDTLYFDVIKVFEIIHDYFHSITTEVISDDDNSILDLNKPCACIPDMRGGYHIVIRESIYEGACQGVGGYRSHIQHEISHSILCLLGFVPIIGRSYKNGELEACRSMEWQAKALTGETLVPFYKTKGMTVKQIKESCGVSKDCAEMRLKIEKDKIKKMR